MLQISDRDGVRVIVIDHGKVNALDLELLRALLDAFGAADQEAPIVLTGAGRAFCAGVDLRRIVAEGDGYTAEFLAVLSDAFVAIFDHAGPVVAAVNGAAIAGGCVIAAACDLRLMSRGPIGLTELAVGVPFPTSALEIMRHAVGVRVQQLMLTAAVLDPGEALAIGLVDELVDEDALLDRAIERARGLAALPEGVFAHTKRQLKGPVRERIAAQAAADDATTRDLWSTRSVRAAVDGYMSDLARRSPARR